MESRQQYIKPSVLRLHYVEDVAVCNIGNCKTNNSSSGQCDGGVGQACDQSSCNAVGT